MSIYLPIAEITVHIGVIVGLGFVVGFLSGLFGVGGGFLLTPLLIVYGVPPSVAVGTLPSQIAASSVSGAITHWRRGAVDLKMGGVLTVGGILGSAVGVYLFRYLSDLGQTDVAVDVSYVVLLTSVGGLMLYESLDALGVLPRRPATLKTTRRRHNVAQILPLRTRFPTSRLYTSILPPLALGFVVGLLAASLGIGGGFLMVPAMIYLLKMPTNVVVGTSLFQILFVTGFTTVMHAAANRTVDILLALMLIAGAVVGAQFGIRLGDRLRAEQLRALLAALVLAVGARIAYGLLVNPSDAFVVKEFAP